MGMWDNLFGQKDKSSARKQQKKASATAANVGAQASPYGAAYDRGTAASFGTDAGDYMKRAQASAAAGAQQQGAAAAQMGTRQATQAARTAGLNKGQAALAGAQRAGDIYQNTVQGATQAGVGNYMAGTGQMAGQGSEMANRQLQAAGVQSGVGAQQLQAGTQQAGAMTGMIGNLAGAGAALMSDKNVKEDIKASPSLREMLEGIDPVAFNYKGNPDEKVGVIAQDLEQTPLAGAVKDTPAGKAIDAPQLTGANTAMIKQLYDRVVALEGGQRGSV